MFNAAPLYNKDTWKSDIIIGLAVGALFIFLNVLAPAISLGLPNLGLAVSDTGTLIVVGLIAPVIEEIFFRSLFLGSLIYLGLGSFMSIILSAAGFMLYHFTAYGGSFVSSSAAFVGAFIFALLATGLVLWRKNIIPGIIVHSLFNVYLLAKLTVVVT